MVRPSLDYHLFFSKSPLGANQKENGRKKKNKNSKCYNFFNEFNISFILFLYKYETTNRWFCNLLDFVYNVLHRITKDTFDKRNKKVIRRMKCEICKETEGKINVILKAFNFEDKLMCLECSCSFLAQYMNYSDSEIKDYNKIIIKRWEKKE